MTEKEEYLRRLDKQDGVLEQLMKGQMDILTKMAEHRVEHEAVDPSIKELVGILKGIKFMRGAVIAIGSVCGTLWLIWIWIKDHLQFKL